MSTLVQTPEPPYYAVIFSSQRTEADRGYGQMAERMMQIASQQPGFLGAESVRGANGFGITVSYWANEEAIAAWKAHLDHKPAQEAGKRIWYADYQLRVAKVERAYGKLRYKIKEDDLRGSEIAALLGEHLRSLAAVTPEGSMHALDIDKLRAPHVTFWSVWDGAQLVGCGALKELDPWHGEVKSMRTAATHLRKGVGSQMLDHLIFEARLRGYRRLSLETGAGPYFTPAHNLYQKFGFLPCGPFGSYKEDSNSRFFTREL